MPLFPFQVGALPDTTATDGNDASTLLLETLDGIGRMRVGVRLCQNTSEITVEPLYDDPMAASRCADAWARLKSTLAGQTVPRSGSPGYGLDDVWRPSSVPNKQGTLLPGVAVLLSRFSTAPWTAEFVPHVDRQNRLQAWTFALCIHNRRHHANLAGTPSPPALLSDAMLVRASTAIAWKKDRTLTSAAMNGTGRFATSAIATAFTLPRSGEGAIGTNIRVQRRHASVAEGLWDSFDPHDLPRHMLITGGPGTGKSVALRSLLAKLAHRAPHTPVVLIDPTKPADEYKSLWGSGYNLFRPLSDGSLNLFAPPEDAEDAYLEHLLDAIDQATAMSEMFPLGRSYLTNALAEARSSTGDVSLFHLVKTLMMTIDRERRGGSRNAPDVMASLMARLTSVFDVLGKGTLAGANAEGIPWKELVSGRTVVELAAIPNMAQKRLVALCLLAGVLDMVRATNRTGGLVIVLEEAHFFFQNNEGRTHRSLLESLLSDAVAELRSRGISIILAEQLPLAVPEGIFSNIGSYVAFPNRDAKQAKRIESALGFSDRAGDWVSQMPDFHAFYRWPSQPVAALAQSTPSASVSLDNSAGTLQRQTDRGLLPWCLRCPAPCAAPSTEDDASAALSVNAEYTGEDEDTPEHAYIWANLSAAAHHLANVHQWSEPLAVRQKPTDITSMRVGVYCLASRMVISDAAFPYKQRARRHSMLASWVSSGQLTG